MSAADWQSPPPLEEEADGWNLGSTSIMCSDSHERAGLLEQREPEIGALRGREGSRVNAARSKSKPSMRQAPATSTSKAVTSGGATASAPSRRATIPVPSIREGELGAGIVAHALAKPLSRGAGASAPGLTPAHPPHPPSARASSRQRLPGGSSGDASRRAGGAVPSRGPSPMAAPARRVARITGPQQSSDAIGPIVGRQAAPPRLPHSGAADASAVVVALPAAAASLARAAHSRAPSHATRTMPRVAPPSDLPLHVGEVRNAGRFESDQSGLSAWVMSLHVTAGHDRATF